jgi:hypothetical protein
MRISTHWASFNSETQRFGVARKPAVTRLQESRTVEIYFYGLTRGVGLTTHSYSIDQAGC